MKISYKKTLSGLFIIHCHMGVLSVAMDYSTRYWQRNTIHPFLIISHSSQKRYSIKVQCEFGLELIILNWLFILDSAKL